MTNVVSSATGTGNMASLSNSIASLQTLINTSNYALSINSIKPYSGSNVTFTNTLNLSNVGLSFNGITCLTSNCINGQPFLAVKTSGSERARFTSGGFGIGTTAPLTTVDVNGNELVRGNLYISTMGGTLPAAGNLYADGNLYAAGMVYPSDPVLKQNVRPYVPSRLPDPVEFEWRSTGLRDIGVMASDVATIEPVCVQTGRTGTQSVDYPKLVVLCLAECKALRAKVTELENEMARLLQKMKDE